MSAHDEMVLLAQVSCTAAVLIIALCLMPGLIEIREKVAKVAKRSSRRGTHRAAADPPTPAGPDGAVQDSQEPAVGR